MVAIRLVRLSEGPLHGPFDLHRLCETHRRIFDGVYDWAGQLRRNTGTMTKQREAGNVISYGDSVYVEPALSKVFAELAWEMQLKGLPANRFALRAAFYYGEIDAIHPFERAIAARCANSLATWLKKQVTRSTGRPPQELRNSGVKSSWRAISPSCAETRPYSRVSSRTIYIRFELGCT
jgi:hypothetical protein